jgi:hypothetical protein
MVTALLELYHGLAPVATLPALSLGLLQDLVCILIARALQGAVPLAIACAAHFGLAPAALRRLAPILAVPIDLLGLDPLATALHRAVDAVARRVLGKLTVPRLLEGRVEKAVHVLEWDVVRGTAPRRHLLGVGKGELKVAFQARVAHAMAAFELGGLVRRLLLVQAHNALHTKGPWSDLLAPWERGNDGTHPSCQVRTHSLTGLSG